jgi:hypothetical protein
LAGKNCNGLFCKPAVSSDFKWEVSMKWIIPTFAAFVLASLISAAPAPFISSDALAGRMDGKPSCGQMNCMQDRYIAAKRKEAKQKKPN